MLTQHALYVYRNYSMILPLKSVAIREDVNGDLESVVKRNSASSATETFPLAKLTGTDEKQHN